MDASRRGAEPVSHPPHGLTPQGSLTFRLGRPINGHGPADHLPAPEPEKAPEKASAPHPGPNAEEPPSVGPNDPRWVLAIRAREALVGRALPEKQRAKLIRLGTVLGLSEPRARSIVEAVENQARRGLEPSAMDLLANLPPTEADEADEAERKRRRIAGHAAFWSLLVLLLELAIIYAVL